MPDFDWRSPETYDSVKALEPTGFAWEFLRRNPDYQSEWPTDANETAATVAHGPRSADSVSQPGIMCLIQLGGLDLGPGPTKKGERSEA
jgi:hypothetical protein